VLALNVVVFITKIIFELSIGLSVVTNLLEILNCILIVAMLISKVIEFTLEASYDESRFDREKYFDFSNLKSTTAVNNSLAILCSMFIPFRFFTLCSHFKVFIPFATMIKVYYRMMSQLLTFFIIMALITITYTTALFFFLAPYVNKFGNYWDSLVAIVMLEFWTDNDYQYMLTYSPYKFIFMGIIVMVVLLRITTIVLATTLGVFVFQKAAGAERMDAMTPLQKQYIEKIETIQETVEWLQNNKKEKMKLKEKKYGGHQNKKIVAWMLNRKKHLNEKERQAFFKKLNPKGKPTGSLLEYDSNKNIFKPVGFF
jgi:uncharacterized protein (UPF0335 family)